MPHGRNDVSHAAKARGRGTLAPRARSLVAMMPEPTPNRPRDACPTMWSLIEGLSGKDQEAAWREFVSRYRPFVNGLLARRLRRTDWIAAGEQDF